MRITIGGEPDETSGLVMNLEDVEKALADAREALDHRMLNEVEGLAVPTLERISIWLWDRLHNRLPGLVEIEVARDSCHEGCVYRGPRPLLAAE